MCGNCHNPVYSSTYWNFLSHCSNVREAPSTAVSVVFRQEAVTSISYSPLLNIFGDQAHLGLLENTFHLFLFFFFTLY